SGERRERGEGDQPGEAAVECRRRASPRDGTAREPAEERALLDVRAAPAVLAREERRRGCERGAKRGDGRERRQGERAERGGARARAATASAPAKAANPASASTWSQEKVVVVRAGPPPARSAAAKGASASTLAARLAACAARKRGPAARPSARRTPSAMPTL